MADTLKNAFKDVADAIRAKGVVGTMTPLEMPQKIASIQGGTSKYGLTVKSMVGDVNQSGQLQFPSASESFSSTEITGLGGYTLQFKFRNNTGLTSVNLPNLVTVGTNATQGAFQGCTSLRTVNLQKMTGAVMANMFNGCTSLEVVDFSKAASIPTLNNTNAFSNTNSTYRILVPNTLYNQWITATNWSNSSIVTHIKKAIKALSFKAGSANSTISLDAVGTPTSIDIEYSTDGGTTFSPYTVGTTITLTSVGDEVYFRAGTTGQSALATDSSNYHKFVMSGSITLEENVSYLLGRSGVPSTTALADYAFYGLFNGCSALQNAPELPWTTMGEGCYGHMFEGCTALTDAPDLPSTSLDDYCYEGMFYGCTGLTTAPELPATTLANDCYKNLFYGCSSLNHISLAYTGNFSTTYFDNWVYGVAASGEISYEGTDTTTGASAIPSGWSIVIDYTKKPITFTARQAGSTVGMVNESSAPTISLQYSTDNGTTWNTFTVGSTTVTLANIGDKVSFRGTNTKLGGGTNNSRNRFTFTGQVAVSGNINSLLVSTGYDQLLDLTSPSRGERIFQFLFYGDTQLVDAENLVFPATKLPGFAYNDMFNGCTNLVKAPKELPNATATSNNYICAGMFKECSSLEVAPYFHITNPPNNFFETTFYNCTNLREIKMNYIGNFSSSKFPNWMSGVQTTSGTFYYNGSDTTRGVNAIPTGWTITPFIPDDQKDRSFIRFSKADLNTGVTPTTTTKVVATLRGTAAGNWFVGTSGQSYRFFNSQTTTYLDVNGQSNRISTANSWDTTKWYDVEFGNFYFKTTDPNGTVTNNTSTARTFTNSNTLYVNSYNYQYGNEYPLFDCARLKIYDGDTLLKDYVPAIDGNNTYCFYDNVAAAYVYPTNGVLTGFIQQA